MGRNYIDFKPESLKKFDSIFKEYSTKASEDNLNSLLELYEMLKPNWVKEFNDFNENLSKRKTTNNEVYDKFLEVQLPEEYSIEELKAPKNRDNNSFMDIMQRGRIIHLSNKIAHVFEKVIENKISAYMTKNGIEIDDKEKDFKDINNLIRGIYSPRTNERKKNYLISKLYLYGFELSDFEKGKNLDIMNFPELIEAYNNAMFIKDTEIENVDTLVFDYDRRDISYGIQEAEKGKTIFVMDIQRFGQFSVHIKDKELISQIRTEYKMPLYNRETNMLVDRISDKAKEFFGDARNDYSLDKERRIPRFISEKRKKRARLKEEIKYLDLKPEKKHELAVKGGLIKRELEEIYESELGG